MDSPKRAAASQRLGEDVVAWIGRHRQHAVSWHEISVRLMRQTQVRVTGETLRQWYNEAVTSSSP